MKRKFIVRQEKDPDPNVQSVQILHGVDKHPDGGLTSLETTHHMNVPQSLYDVRFGTYLGPDMEPPHQPRVGIYLISEVDVEEVHVDRPPVSNEWIVEEKNDER